MYLKHSFTCTSTYILIDHIMNAPTIDSYNYGTTRPSFEDNPETNAKLAPTTKIAIIRHKKAAYDYYSSDNELAHLVPQFVTAYGLEQYLSDFPIKTNW
jgi:hypothetical protein